jgi:hypothetical protein
MAGCRSPFNPALIGPLVVLESSLVDVGVLHLAASSGWCPF